jgi:hypothetical protein
MLLVLGLHWYGFLNSTLLATVGSTLDMPHFVGILTGHIMAKPVTQHDADTFNKFIADIRNESDRAAVILAAAKIDLLVYQILQKFFLPSTSSRDELLDGDAALGTFSSRINAVHRVGLIAADFTRALHLLRRIRNSFAHEFSGISLNTGAHADRIRELVGGFDKSGAFMHMRHKHFGADATPAQSFRAAVSIMSARLEAVFDDCRQITSGTPYELCPPESELFKLPEPAAAPEKKA